MAITDHNTIRGGVEARRITGNSDFLVVVGAEIATDAGDIIGLFLDKEIKKRIVHEVLSEIRQQGGIAILPHPYKSHKLSDEMIKGVDAIEVYNARASKRQNRDALELAREYGKPAIVGSDAHSRSEIGTCRVKIKSPNIRSSILKSDVAFETGRTPLYKESLSQFMRSVRLQNYPEAVGHLGAAVLRMITEKIYERYRS
jgi:hypothetical protein